MNRVGPDGMMIVPVGQKEREAIVSAALYRTEDFVEGRRAEAEGRLPKYQGK